ncbi:MAG: hypothetical protein AB7J30_13000 [Hyphomicrobium sp.]|uniref:hypothetical protein n=1 Tax=Hyphomicrobium sp. TaxID=82 RepID=UPI003D0A07A5
MINFKHRPGTLASAGSASFVRTPVTGHAGPDGTREPMQQALDDWYRRQPEVFEREGDARSPNDPANEADHAIALNHLLVYGRLAVERDLAVFRDRAEADGSFVLAPLLQQTEARSLKIIAAAPGTLHAPLRAGLSSIAENLMRKASEIDARTAARSRTAAIEQSIQLGEAVLGQDPEQYPQLVADAEAMTSKLGLEADEQRTLFESIRRRYATAARNSRPQGSTTA